MNKTHSFIVAKEGFYVVLSVAVVTVLVLFFSESFLLKLCVLLAFMGTLYLVRNPERVIERLDEGAIFSVCDGVVSNIETIECKGKLQGECFRVTVVNRLIDTPMLRAPYEATLATKEVRRGVQLAPHSPKSAILNEHAKLVFSRKDKSDSKIVVKHLLNRFDLPLSFYKEEAGSFAAGERYGFMFHGTTQIFLSGSSRLAVKPGDELKAGETVIGYNS